MKHTKINKYEINLNFNDLKIKYNEFMKLNDKESDEYYILIQKYILENSNLDKFDFKINKYGTLESKMLDMHIYFSEDSIQIERGVTNSGNEYIYLIYENKDFKEIKKEMMSLFDSLNWFKYNDGPGYLEDVYKME